MSNLSDYLRDSVTLPYRATVDAGPGSNGYWRRDIFRRVGTFTWTAEKTGKIKIQAIGAASGGCGTTPGSSGAFGEKTLAVTKGQQLTLVLGEGSLGNGGNNTGYNLSLQAGSTSISGTPVGATPLVLVGAAGVQNSQLSAAGAPGYGTGPWDLTNPGAKSLAISCGSPSSGSPFAPGFANNKAGDYGGCGWGGRGRGAGASSHKPAGPSTEGAAGLLAKGGTPTGGLTPTYGESRPFWDMRDFDGGGGSSGNIGGDGGVGAGGGYSTASNPGVSLLGGGTGGISTTSGYSNDNYPKSGPGGGGAPSAGTTSTQGPTAGIGGDAYIMIFWDEVL